MPNRTLLLCTLMLLSVVASTASANSVLIDLTGNGGVFDFETNSGTSPIEPGSLLTLSLMASPGDATVNATGVSLGVNAAFSGSESRDSTNLIDEFVFDPSNIDPMVGPTLSTPFIQESLTLTFNFSGFLTGIDLESVGSQDRLTISDGLTSQKLIGFVDGLSPATGDVVLGGADALAMLPVPVAFFSNQPLVVSVGGVVPFLSGGASIGIDSITVQAIPSPTAISVGVIGSIALLGRRRTIR